MKPTLEFRRVHRPIPHTDQVPIVLQQRWTDGKREEWRDVPLEDIYVY